MNVHPLMTHRDGQKCVLVDGRWFVPLDAGGEGHACGHPEHGEHERPHAARVLREAADALRDLGATERAQAMLRERAAALLLDPEARRRLVDEARRARAEVAGAMRRYKGAMEALEDAGVSREAVGGYAHAFLPGVDSPAMGPAGSWCAAADDLDPGDVCGAGPEGHEPDPRPSA